jgi:predicted metal-dependent HD superfamily phosphohydrolase
MAKPGVAQVKELILDTRHEGPPATENGRFMVDIDLTGLAQAPEAFDEDGRAIRNEYAHVDEESFRRGRADFFERFLARPSIYFTPFFRQRCEAQARQNLSRALRRLRVA